MANIEIWKVISGFPNYEISTLGNIRNIVTGKTLTPVIKGGYFHVSLSHNKLRKSFKMHRLVAIAFIDNPENKSDVNHKDKNKLNNKLENLEWMTRKENNVHRCQGIIITCNKNKPIFRINKETDEIIEEYNSIELAGEWAHKKNLTQNSHNGRNAIGNCLKGLKKTAYHFKWKYKNLNQDLEGEIWKQIIIENQDSENIKYFVSNLGRFKNSSGTIMDNYKTNDNGYIRVYIYNKTYALHRLIAYAFLENPENKEQVNHIDGNKKNNAISNLEWVTNTENQIHKHKIGLGNCHTRAIIQYDLNMNKIKEFTSIIGASKELNIGKSNIRGVLINSRKTAGGFIFKYLEETPN
jgi:hypothetical protein